MRIGIDVRALQGLSGRRGIGRYVGDMIDALIRYYPDDTYVFLAGQFAERPARLRAYFDSHEWHTFGAVLPTDPPETLMRVPKVRSIPAVKAYSRKARFKKYSTSYEAAVRAAKLDVMHVTSPVEYEFSSLGHHSVHTVATFLDAIPLVMKKEFFDQWEPVVQDHYLAQMENLRTMNRVAGISKSARDEAVRYAGTDPKKTHYIYSMVPEAFTGSDDPASSKHLLSEMGVDRPYFVFCSVIDWQKNFEGLLHAFSKIVRQGFQLVCIAPKSGVVYERSIHTAWDLNLSAEVVRFVGRVTDEQLRALYANAVAAVVPSFAEGFGLPAAEAMSLGTPVIASNRTSLPEVVGDAGILVDPDDHQAMADAMLRLASEPELRARLSDLGKKQVAQFTPERLALGYHKLYRDEDPNA